MTDMTRPALRAAPQVGAAVALAKPDFDGLLERLRALGYATLGPRIQAGALTYAPITALTDLPRGYVSEQDGGRYRLVHAGHSRYFDIVVGAASWKPFLFPPRSTLFSLRREGGWKMDAPARPAPRYAFVGVRPCDLAAIGVQDRVFIRDDFTDPTYRARRENLFILAANCLHPAGTCFCASMGTGPRAGGHFDLCLTELEEVFLLEAGSELGRAALADLPCQPASAYQLRAAHDGLARAAGQMGRALDTSDLPGLLLDNPEHPLWAAVADRCLSCANCTQVCPTCFCWDVVDHTSLAGDQTRRERVWDSCFNPAYSYQAGGNTRPTIRARYRQWLTHKLGTWPAQFGVSGCVGCGRCITWCPVGIDLTAEVPRLHAGTAKEAR